MWMGRGGRSVEEIRMRGFKRVRALAVNIGGDLSQVIHQFKDWPDRLRGMIE